MRIIAALLACLLLLPPVLNADEDPEWHCRATVYSAVREAAEKFAETKYVRHILRGINRTAYREEECSANVLVTAVKGTEEYYVLFRIHYSIMGKWIPKVPRPEWKLHSAHDAWVLEWCAFLEGDNREDLKEYHQCN